MWEPVPEEPVAGSGVAEPDASSAVLKESLDPVREADGEAEVRQVKDEPSLPHVSFAYVSPGVAEEAAKGQGHPTANFRGHESRFTVQQPLSNQLEPYVPPSFVEQSTKGKGVMMRSTSPRFQGSKSATENCEPYVQPGLADEMSKLKGKTSAVFRGHSPRFVQTQSILTEFCR